MKNNRFVFISTRKLWFLFLSSLFRLFSLTRFDLWCEFPPRVVNWLKKWLKFINFFILFVCKILRLFIRRVSKEFSSLANTYSSSNVGFAYKWGIFMRFGILIFMYSLVVHSLRIDRCSYLYLYSVKPLKIPKGNQVFICNHPRSVPLLIRYVFFSLDGKKHNVKNVALYPKIIILSN